MLAVQAKSTSDGVSTIDNALEKINKASKEGKYSVVVTLSDEAHNKLRDLGYEVTSVKDVKAKVLEIKDLEVNQYLVSWFKVKG